MASNTLPINLLVDTMLAAPSAYDGFTLPEQKVTEYPSTTFMYTDIEDSTGHWQRVPVAMRAAHEAHDILVRHACETYQGRIFRQIGDAFCIAFTHPADAVGAALEIQTGLQNVFLDTARETPLRARLALHTGQAEPQGEDFYGLAPARVARVLEGTQGGQVLLTADTAEQVLQALPSQATLADLGPCRLRSFEHVEHLFQLHHPDLPLIVTPPRSAVAVPNNLPRQLTPFFGRDGEIAEARRRLTTYNLLTLVGMGGCGKTRLSLRLTDFLFSDYADGIFFADLSGLQENSQVAQTVASVLGVSGDKNTAVVQQVVHFLRERSVLLLLDNCEQIIDGAAELAAAILDGAPKVRIIATSREALGVLGEALLPVRPLPLPETPQFPELLQWEAVRLFAERAASQSPRFQVTRENAPAVASVCRRVEGIPLGLVLSAAWASEYTPEEIAEQLEERFNLLMTGRIRSLPARHRTLYATVDWGYSLLTSDEQTLLRCLAIFRGGCTLEAAEAVCAGEVADVPKALGTLVRKSLLVEDREAAPNAVRYRLMEPVREYGEERLREFGVWEMLVNKHRIYFVSWAEAIAPRTIAVDSRAALEEVDAENENLQAALQSADQAGDGEAGIRFIASLYWHWHARGMIALGRRWVQRFLNPDTPANANLTYAKAISGAAVLALDAGEHAMAKMLYLQAADICRELGDQERLARNFANVGLAAMRMKDFDEAKKYLHQAIAAQQDSDNDFVTASALSTLGSIAVDQLEFDLATDYLNRAVTIQRRYPPTSSLGVALSHLATIAKTRQQWSIAFDCFKECFYLRRDLKNPVGIAYTLEYLPAVLFGLGRVEAAVLVYGFAQNYREQLGVQDNLDQLEMFVQDGQTIRAAVGEALFEEKSRQGRLLSLDVVAKILFESE